MHSGIGKEIWAVSNGTMSTGFGGDEELDCAGRMSCCGRMFFCFFKKCVTGLVRCWGSRKEHGHVRFVMRKEGMGWWTAGHAMMEGVKGGGGGACVGMFVVARKGTYHCRMLGCEKGMTQMLAVETELLFSAVCEDGELGIEVTGFELDRCFRQDAMAGACAFLQR